jgi:hypothetical protein
MVGCHWRGLRRRGQLSYFACHTRFRGADSFQKRESVLGGAALDTLDKLSVKLRVWHVSACWLRANDGAVLAAASCVQQTPRQIASRGFISPLRARSLEPARRHEADASHCASAGEANMGFAWFVLDLWRSGDVYPQQMALRPHEARGANTKHRQGKEVVAGFRTTPSPVPRRSRSPTARQRSLQDCLLAAAPHYGAATVCSARKQDLRGQRVARTALRWVACKSARSILPQASDPPLPPRAIRLPLLRERRL